MRYLYLLLILGCLGCGNSFSLLGETSGQNSRFGGGFQNLDYKGTINGGPNDGVMVVNIDSASEALILVLPLQLNKYIEVVKGTVPNLEGTKFETYKDSQGKSYLAVSVPLRYVANGASNLPVARLPNGDALPQVTAGELPSVAITLPGKNTVELSLYLGVNMVGAFVSSPMNPAFPIQFPIRSGTTEVGYYNAVPAVNAFNGGFFLITSLPTDVAAVVNDHFGF